MGRKNLINQNPKSFQNVESGSLNTTTETEKDLIKNDSKDIGKVSGIYKIINKVNGKYYVGSSKNILGYKGRWYNHKDELKNKRHKNDYLQKAWNKYGESSFEWIIVENIPNNTTKEKILLIEQKYLDIAKTEQYKCYNLNFKASGGELSEYSKQKISEKNKGRVITPEMRRKISEKNKGKCGILSKSYGRKLSKERVEFLKNRIVSKETRIKIGLKSKLKIFTPEYRKKLSIAFSGSKNPMFGKCKLNHPTYKPVNENIKDLLIKYYIDFGFTKSQEKRKEFGMSYRKWYNEILGYIKENQHLSINPS